MDGSAELEKMERHREKGVVGRSGFFDLPPVERDKSILRRHEEGDNAPRFSGDCEKRIENAVDDVVRRFCNLAEMGHLWVARRLCLHVLIENGEDERRQKKRAVEGLRCLLFHFGIDFVQ